MTKRRHVCRSVHARALLLLLGAFGAPLCVGASFGAFSSAASNPTSSFSAAADFCVSPGSSQTVTTDGDAWINEAAPGQNHDLAIKLDVRSSTTAGRRRTFVHFPLPALPHNCSVTSATLRLSTLTLGAATIAVYQAASSWSEAGVKWNNQPGTTGSAATASAGAGWVSWTVTSQVQAMYSGTNTGFIAMNAAETTSDVANTYASRETGANPPELTVSFG